MRAILTGADGFIGSNVVKNLISHKVSVLGLDISEKPHRMSTGNALFKYISLPLQRLEELSSIVKHGDYDVFYHFAWRGSGGSERANAEVQLENVTLAVKAMKVAAAIGCKKFVFVSSIVELETIDLTYSDDSTPDPHYIYGGAKGACHMLLKPLANELGIDLVWTNICGVYGIGDTTPNFVNSVLNQIISGGPLLFTKGQQYFDFVYIDDVAEAFYLLGKGGRRNRSYIVGSGHPETIRSFVKDILFALSSKREADFGAIPYHGQFLPKGCFDISKISSDCGYTAKINFVDGIKITYDWLCSQQTGDK
jgi:UDP-glucose 4-epimerase